MTVKRFRGEAARRREGRKRGASRYSTDLREFAVSHARAVTASGGSVHRAARELGISEVTLGGWLQKSAQPSRLREAQVAPATEATQSEDADAVTVTTVAGHVVTRLTVGQAAQLALAQGRRQDLVGLVDLPGTVGKFVYGPGCPG